MDPKKTALLLNIVKFVLSGIGVLACILVINGPNTTAGSQAVEEFRDGFEMSFAMLFTIVVIFACVALILAFFVIHFISQPKKTALSIMGILVSLVVYMVFYFAGTTDTYKTLLLNTEWSDEVVKTTTAGIYTTFVALIVAVLVIVFLPIYIRFKK
jgi:phosphoglycerol transferase MdoB-like AlkP superfamily enzyme